MAELEEERRSVQESNSLNHFSDISVVKSVSEEEKENEEPFLAMQE